jgi:hypothetical protein
MVSKIDLVSDPSPGRAPLLARYATSERARGGLIVDVELSGNGSREIMIDFVLPT